MDIEFHTARRLELAALAEEIENSDRPSRIKVIRLKHIRDEMSKLIAKTEAAIEALEKGTGMKLAFIGMSGAGKSYWAQKFSETFHVISIDDMIAKRLGLADVSAVAGWMGWPDEPGYRDRERQYLECEVLSMNEALDEIQANEENFILDTSGSVVYMDETICGRMKSLTSVMYLKETDEALLQRYLSKPKPLIWGDQFDQLPGETASQAVVRCYPKLIAHRKKFYEFLAG